MKRRERSIQEMFMIDNNTFGSRLAFVAFACYIFTAAPDTRTYTDRVWREVSKINYAKQALLVEWNGCVI